MFVFVCFLGVHVRLHVCVDAGSQFIFQHLRSVDKYIDYILSNCHILCCIYFVTEKTFKQDDISEEMQLTKEASCVIN